MKMIVSLVFFLLIINSFAFDQECRVSVNIQVYSKVPFGIKLVDNKTSEWFAVTKQEHETPYAIDLISEKSKASSSTVWTGTLLNTPEGDLIQVHANLLLEGQSADLNLVMATDASFAKSIEVIDFETEDDIYLMPIELACRNI